MRLKGGPLWNRIAAGTGLDFVVALGAVAIIAQVKDFENSSDFITASNEVWGVAALLVAFASIFFLWFTSIFVARMHQIERAMGTSGRLANAAQIAGSVIAGGLMLVVVSQWTARELGGDEIGLMATAILEGPALLFPIAAYIGAAGICVVRADGVSPPSRIIALLSLLIAPGYVAMAGVQLFTNYAWMDETALIVFLAWVAAVSAVGVQRWGSIDEGWVPGRGPSRPVVEHELEVLPPMPEPLPGEPEDDETQAIPRPRKTAARKKKKPAPRKSPARKS